jgi:hypothetical protein
VLTEDPAAAYSDMTQIKGYIFAIKMDGSDKVG